LFTADAEEVVYQEQRINWLTWNPH